MANNLAQFRPLTVEMQKRVKAAAEETKRLLDNETAIGEKGQNKSYIEYLRSHLRMLENELKIVRE